MFVQVRVTPDIELVLDIPDPFLGAHVWEQGREEKGREQGKDILGADTFRGLDL